MQDSDVIKDHLTHITPPVLSSENIGKPKIFWCFSGGKKQNSGIKLVKILSKIDIHWSFKVKVRVILFKFDNLFSLKSFFFGLTST